MGSEIHSPAWIPIQRRTALPAMENELSRSLWLSATSEVTFHKDRAVLLKVTKILEQAQIQ
jgi:hypothetical protein